MIGILTGQTCGDACWHAREDECHCSCGGKNHGCLRTAEGEQPVRTAKIDGLRCELKAVGYPSDLDREAQLLNKAHGIDFRFAHTARQHYGYSPYAMMRPATVSQVKKWPELAAYRNQMRPYLLWVRKEDT